VAREAAEAEAMAIRQPGSRMRLEDEVREAKTQLRSASGGRTHAVKLTVFPPSFMASMQPPAYEEENVLPGNYSDVILVMASARPIERTRGSWWVTRSLYVARTQNPPG